MRLQRYAVLFFLLALFGATLSSCITRSELDSYTITMRDTTFREEVRNNPGGAGDNGVVFPSSRTTYVSRVTTSYDSSHTRDYPAFLRFGAIEMAGFITNSSSAGIGNGLLGAYGLIDSNKITGLFSPKKGISSFFKGSLLRIIPMEYQLHWFEESPNWTYGLSAVEVLRKDEQKGNTLESYGANLYIRRRFFLRDRIPYVIAQPFVGISAFPSMYANIGGELQLGSFGGFNLRAYAGFAAGFNYIDSPRTKVAFPYIGLGVSALDFVNRVEETEREWKEYVHSAIEVSAVDVTFIKAFNNYRNLFDTTVPLPITGSSVKLATAHFPVPIGNGHWWVGTSLFNFFALGFEQSTWSVLPIRVGYRHYLIAEDMLLEPFLEFNYYPSRYFNLGAKLRLDLFNGYTVGLQGGLASGTTGAFLPSFFDKTLSDKGADFNSFYLGVSVGLKDYLHRPEAVEAMRASEH